jgi:hypothetical protein
MKSALSLTLIVCLVGSTLPVTAQEPVAAGPVARSITREAARFAAQPNQSAESNWSRVRKLASGTEIIMTVKGSPSVRRSLVAADDSDLSVLNVGDPALPAAARDVLRDVATTHPESFQAAKKGGTFVLEKNVRVEPDGVFVADRKVTDLAQVVEQYGRPDITEIKAAKTESNPVGCAFAGYYGGAVVGGLPGVLIGSAVGRDTGPALLGMMVGWSMGAVYLYRKCRHKPEKVVYLAP